MLFRQTPSVLERFVPIDQDLATKRARAPHIRLIAHSIRQILRASSTVSPCHNPTQIELVPAVFADPRLTIRSLRMSRRQNLFRHTRAPFRGVLCVLFVLQVLHTALVVLRLFVIRQGLGIGKVFPRLNAIKLTTTWQVVIEFELDGLSSLLRLLNLIPDLVNVLLSTTEPQRALEVLVLRASALLLCLHASSHGIVSNRVQRNDE